MKETIFALLTVAALVIFVGFIAVKIVLCTYHSLTPMCEAPLICRN